MYEQAKEIYKDLDKLYEVAKCGYIRPHWMKNEEQRITAYLGFRQLLTCMNWAICSYSFDNMNKVARIAVCSHILSAREVSYLLHKVEVFREEFLEGGGVLYGKYFVWKLWRLPPTELKDILVRRKFYIYQIRFIQGTYRNMPLIKNKFYDKLIKFTSITKCLPSISKDSIFEMIQLYKERPMDF